jgi:hypothetical protein
MEGRAGGVIVLRPPRDGIGVWRVVFAAMMLVATPVAAYLVGAIACAVPAVPGILLWISGSVAAQRRGLFPWIVLGPRRVRVVPYAAPSGAYREDAHRAASLDVDGLGSESERIEGVLVVERRTRKNFGVFLVTTERAVLLRVKPTREEAEALAAELAAPLGPEARVGSTLRDPSVPNVELGGAVFAFVGELMALIVVGPLALALTSGPDEGVAGLARGAAAAVALIAIDAAVVRTIARKYAAAGTRVLDEALEDLRKTEGLRDVGAVSQSGSEPRR